MFITSSYTYHSHKIQALARGGDRGPTTITKRLANENAAAAAAAVAAVSHSQAQLLQPSMLTAAPALQPPGKGPRPPPRPNNTGGEGSRGMEGTPGGVGTGTGTGTEGENTGRGPPVEDKVERSGESKSGPVPVKAALTAPAATVGGSHKPSS